jgi:hypothetical protein
MYLALLRGINVGGKNKVPMKDLVEIFMAVGSTGAPAATSRSMKQRKSAFEPQPSGRSPPFALR